MKCPFDCCDKIPRITGNTYRDCQHHLWIAHGLSVVESHSIASVFEINKKNGAKVYKIIFSFKVGDGNQSSVDEER
jgi:hypothetical protein